MAATAAMAATTITEDEVKLYDRQIRLWGLEAQARCVRACRAAPGPTGENEAGAWG